MLSANTATILSAFTYRPDAERAVWCIPFVGIIWNDELPEVRELIRIPEEDNVQIFRMFDIRSRLWKAETLSREDEQLWSTIRSQVPNWALFSRERISAEEMRAQQEAELESAKAFEEFFADADEVTISEKDGVQAWSATFNLKKHDPVGPSKAWWQRLLKRVFRH